MRYLLQVILLLLVTAFTSYRIEGERGKQDRTQRKTKVIDWHDGCILIRSRDHVFNSITVVCYKSHLVTVIICIHSTVHIDRGPSSLLINPPSFPSIIMPDLYRLICLIADIFDDIGSVVDVLSVVLIPIQRCDNDEDIVVKICKPSSWKSTVSQQESVHVAYIVTYQQPFHAQYCNRN